MRGLMIIDFHTHIFPKEILKNRERYCFDDPAFNLLYKTPESKLAGVEELIAAMDEQQVDLSVIVGFPWKDSDTFKRHNDYIMEAVQKYPGRLQGFACFDLFHENAAAETVRCLEEGLSGIGELANYHSGIDDRALKHLEPVMEICQKKNRPVLIHTNEPVGHLYPGKTPLTLAQVYRLVRKFSQNRLVLAHWGGGIFFFNLLKKEVRETLQNVYFDTAASPFLYDAQIYRIAIQLVGAQRILFGSDFPLLKPKRYFEEMQKSGLSKADILNICGRNAMHLLGL